MRSRRLLRLGFLAMALAVAAMIFCFSAQTAAESDRASLGLAERVLRLLSPGFADLPEEARAARMTVFNLIVRKGGHFGEYALLGAALAGFFRLSPRPVTARRAALWAWLTAALYACTDEAHQMLVDGRGPSLLDVGIDGFGALVGALLLIAAAALLRRRKRT